MVDLVIERLLGHEKVVLEECCRQKSNLKVLRWVGKEI